MRHQGLREFDLTAKERATLKREIVKLEKRCGVQWQSMNNFYAGKNNKRYSLSTKQMVKKMVGVKDELD